MTGGPIYVSSDKLEQMKKELHYLKTQKRREIAARIEKAKELGDLSENAEYAEAKDEFSFTEGRILELEDAIPRAEVIEAGSAKDQVAIGSRVKVTVNGKEKEFNIVGSTEADPVKGYISNESPIGLALIGKKPGETAEVRAPSGPIRYQITAII